MAGHNTLDASGIQHVAGEHVVEWLARDPFGNQRERCVVGVAVGPARAGGKAAWRGGPERDVGCDRRCGIVRQRPVTLQPEEIRQARCLRHQVRHPKVRVIGKPFGQVIADGGIETHLAGIGERKDCRGSELLRDGTEWKYRVFVRCRLAMARRSVAALQDDVIAAKDGDVGSRNAPPRHDRAYRCIGFGGSGLGRRLQAGGGQQRKQDDSLIHPGTAVARPWESHYTARKYHS